MQDALSSRAYVRCMNEPSTDIREALAIAAALRVTIPMARERGWTSERTFREAEARAREALAHSAPTLFAGGPPGRSRSHAHGRGGVVGVAGV
jgi:hypothetical protein